MTGGTIGWAMESYRREIINEKDTDRLKLEWGDADVVSEFMRKIAYREGFRNIFAKGGAKAADIIDPKRDNYAIHIKGQDLSELCRGSNAWALWDCKFGSRCWTNDRRFNVRNYYRVRFGESG
jgi:aldehyde:ferredoxin oxidoreductase